MRGLFSEHNAVWSVFF